MQRKAGAVTKIEFQIDWALHQTDSTSFHTQVQTQKDKEQKKREVCEKMNTLQRSIGWGELGGWVRITHPLVQPRLR